MELCYEGGLVMPSSYAMMDEDEMAYVEGGAAFSAQRLANNLYTLYNYWGALGLTASMVYCIGFCAYATIVARFSWVGTRLGAIGGFVGAVIGAVVGAAVGGTALFLLGKYDLPSI